MRLGQALRGEQVAQPHVIMFVFAKRLFIASRQSALLIDVGLNFRCLLSVLGEQACQNRRHCLWGLPARALSVMPLPARPTAQPRRRCFSIDSFFFVSTFSVSNSASARGFAFGCFEDRLAAMRRQRARLLFLLFTFELADGSSVPCILASSAANNAAESSPAACVSSILSAIFSSIAAAAASTLAVSSSIALWRAAAASRNRPNHRSQRQARMLPTVLGRYSTN